MDGCNGEAFRGVIQDIELVTLSPWFHPDHNMSLRTLQLTDHLFTQSDPIDIKEIGYKDISFAGI
jgi:hypothetical protein